MVHVEFWDVLAYTVSESPVQASVEIVAQGFAIGIERSFRICVVLGAFRLFPESTITRLLTSICRQMQYLKGFPVFSLHLDSELVTRASLPSRKGTTLWVSRGLEA